MSALPSVSTQQFILSSIISVQVDRSSTRGIIFLGISYCCSSFVPSCPLRLGDAQRIACDELVRSEECTCCPRICATAVTHMDPALLHRMNDLIQGRRITPQLLTSCLTFNVNYQDYQELNDLRQLTKAMNASTLSRVVMNKSVIIKVLISIAQQQV